MRHKQLLERITSDPDVCFGKACIRDTRIWVSRILDELVEGATAEQILEKHPELEETDISACLAHGAEMTRINDFPPEPCK